MINVRVAPIDDTSQEVVRVKVDVVVTWEGSPPVEAIGTAEDGRRVRFSADTTSLAIIAAALGSGEQVTAEVQEQSLRPETHYLESWPEGDPMLSGIFFHTGKPFEPKPTPSGGTEGGDPR